MSEKYLYNRALKKNSEYNIIMAFPSITSFSLSSLGFMSLFAELDKQENIYVERVCTDTDKTNINFNDVDSICFSFSFDMDFMGIFLILEKYNIPFKSIERDANYPIIFCGGPVVSANPEPYKNFFDFFVIGDGEELNLQVTEVCKLAKKNNIKKTELLNKLSKINGVYVPYISENVKKSTCSLSKCVCTPILSNDSFFKDTFIIEISRGCYNRCGFCLASYLNLPVRFVDYSEIIENIELGLKYTNKIALLGALISAHPKFNDICNYIYNKIQDGHKIELSVSSLRTDAITKTVLKTLKLAGQKNTTIAIEAASERLRKVINKNLTEKQIFEAVKLTREAGMNGIKIYSMLGLPTEKDEDIKEFIRLAKQLKKTNKGFDITFSFSTFVPKPHTPFQWCGRENIKLLTKKQNYLQKELHKIGVKSKFSSPKWDYYQALLSRGDSSLTEFIIDVYKSGGKLGAYKTAQKTHKIDTYNFAEKNYNLNQKLPWDFINVSPGKDFLISEYNRLISN